MHIKQAILVNAVRKILQSDMKTDIASGNYIVDWGLLFELAMAFDDHNKIFKDYSNVNSELLPGGPVT